MDLTKLMNIVEANKEDMIETLSQWIKIPSVKSEPAEGAPMGEDINNMLNKAIEDCEKMGFEVKNFGGYVCDARMGKLGVDPLAILGHLDIVPVGDGWKQDPFGAEIIDGKLFGRGAIDDKGPVVAALYAMKAVKEAGIPLKREVRLILGTDEESGWEDIDYYKEHCELPNSGFSPDAQFPVINTEKGLFRVKLTAKSSQEGLKVVELNTGERPNVIPGKCKAIVEGGDDLLNSAISKAKQLGIELSAKIDGKNVVLETQGIPGHAAMPEEAKNAIGLMLVLLKEIGLEGPLETIANTIGTETNGESLGIKVKDKVSGPLTLNIGIIRVNPEDISITLDIRFPMLVSSDALLKAISLNLKNAGFKSELLGATQPHHVPESSELVQKLLQAYNEETGLPKHAIAIGGGTYARALKEGVAFGSIFPGEAELAHQAGEYISLDSLMKNARIFAKAIALLAGE